MSDLERTLQRLFEIYPRNPRYFLAALEDLQAALEGVSEAAIGPMANHFRVKEEDVRVWLNKSDLFRPPGPQTDSLKVCGGPVCRSAGSDRLFKDLASWGAKLGLDVRWTHCLGACLRPPVVSWKGKRLGSAEPERVKAALRAGDSAP